MSSEAEQLGPDNLWWDTNDREFLDLLAENERIVGRIDGQKRETSEIATGSSLEIDSLVGIDELAQVASGRRLGMRIFGGESDIHLDTFTLSADLSTEEVTLGIYARLTWIERELGKDATSLAVVTIEQEEAHDMINKLRKAEVV